MQAVGEKGKEKDGHLSRNDWEPAEYHFAPICPPSAVDTCT